MTFFYWYYYGNLILNLFFKVVSVTKIAATGYMKLYKASGNSVDDDRDNNSNDNNENNVAMNSDAKQPKNYRPIAILLILYKLFSKVLCTRMQDTLIKAQSVDQAGST